MKVDVEMSPYDRWMQTTQEDKEGYPGDIMSPEIVS